MSQCPHCHADVSDSLTNAGFCPYCGAKSKPDLPYATSRGGDNAFFNHVAQYVSIVKSVLTAPTAFFRRVPVGQSFWSLVLFATINQIIGIMGAFGFQMVFGFFSAAIQGAVNQRLPFEELAASFFTPVAAIGLIVLSPVFAIMGLFLQAAISHVSLIIVGGSKKGFDATLTVCGYSTSAQVFQIIPLLGSLVSIVYTFVLLAIGLKEVHGTSGTKAAMAVLLPSLVCCCGCVLVVALIFAGVFMSSLPL